MVDDSNESKSAGSQHMQARKSRQMAKHLELDDAADWDEVHHSKNQVKLGLSNKSIDELLYFKTQFGSILSTYLHAVDELKNLIDVEYIPMEVFLQNFKNFQKQECTRIPVILSRFEAMRVFESAITEYKGEKNVRVMWLTEEWNDCTVLNILSLKIYKYISW